MARSRKAKRGKKPLPAWQLAAAVVVIKLLYFTCRKRVVDPHHVLRDPAGPVIGAAWHNRLLLIAMGVPHRIRRKSVALTSRSRDGAYATRLAEAFGVRCVRGSSSRGALSALRGLLREIEAGQNVFITPDGPRGPRYCVQGGVLALAEQSGAVIVPSVPNASRYWELKGWDRTQIPKPFCCIELRLGKPIRPDQLRALPREQALNHIRQAILEETRDRPSAHTPDK